MYTLSSLFQIVNLNVSVVVKDNSYKVVHKIQYIFKETQVLCLKCIQKNKPWTKLLETIAWSWST